MGEEDHKVSISSYKRNNHVHRFPGLGHGYLERGRRFYSAPELGNFTGPKATAHKQDFLKSIFCSPHPRRLRAATAFAPLSSVFPRKTPQAWALRRLLCPGAPFLLGLGRGEASKRNLSREGSPLPPSIRLSLQDVTTTRNRVRGCAGHS